MLSHHQFSKPCESYRHVKDGESRTLAGNREPQTIWCLWLLLCGHPYMPRGYLYFRSEVELNLRAREHLPAGPLQQAADEQLWGDVTLWVSSWHLLPWLWHWGSRQGLLVRHRDSELKAAFHHSGGKRKGQEMYLSAFVVWKWQEFFWEKKKSSFSDQKYGPVRRSRRHSGHEEGQWEESLLCSAWTPTALLFFSCIVHSVTSVGELDHETMIIRCL